MATDCRYVCPSASQHRQYRRIEIVNIFKIALVLILLVNVRITESSENVTNDDVESKHNDMAARMRIIGRTLGKSFFSDVYQNGTFRTGNNLWDDILNKCTKSPSVSCLQKNVYSYLDDSLKFDGDVNLASGVCFKKNNVDVNKYSEEANVIYLTGSKDTEEARAQDEENEIKDEEESESPFEEVTDALYDKGIKFLVTHDMKLTLPEFFFHGATLKVSPRALTKTGALVHIDLEPKETQGEGRIFINKIKKHIRKKLITAAIAIVLVIKLIALKLVFVLPLIMGVTTAKKIFLKLLLFLFPALSHIFKLCSWYHNSYHTSKYHHHHHLITHHHKVPHAPIYGHSPHGPHGATVVVRPHAAGPPTSHDLHPHEHGSPGFENYPQDWELSGPGLGNEYIAADIHRNAIANFKPHANDMNDIKSWGLGLPPGTSMNVGEIAASANSPLPNGQRISQNSAGRPMGPPHGYRKKPKDPLQAEKEALIRAAALAARAPPSPVRDELLRVSAAKLTETNRVKAETELDTIAAEKFYGQLLEKVDHILSPLGAGDPGCKERAVCALYKDPFKHTPYSNLVSNELSKDSNELVPPADSKLAIHYYRYVQAARDGQEQKDCSLLYPDCHIDYNKK
ncbi:hypothetical protein MSG28_014238 [Choristoneura fumiferana]|uniref:Uncharacterized protein n=1 Tax=Choristoneura fumiferana TaxID=7141 RepID=A0ACC0JGI6_CHOFU|nr:hypothetical protein MSG28_014238 [Choristoneura fumiferana]